MKDGIISVLILLIMIICLFLPIISYANDNENITDNSNKLENNNTNLPDNKTNNIEDNFTNTKEEQIKNETNNNSSASKNGNLSIDSDVEKQNGINEYNEKIEEHEETAEQKNEVESTRNSAKVIEDGEYKIKTAKNSSKLMSIENGQMSDCAKVEIRENTNENQNKFKITYLDDGYYKIESILSGKVLDVPGQSKNIETKIQQYTYNGTDAQKWIIKDSGDGKSYNIISKCNDLYMDLPGGSTSNGTKVQIYEGNGTVAQKFIFEKIEHEKGEQTIADRDI